MIGKPTPAEPLYVSVSRRTTPWLFWAARDFGSMEPRTVPLISFVPDFVTAFTMTPDVRPNSAVMDARLMFTSTMSSSFVSMPMYP